MNDGNAEASADRLGRWLGAPGRRTGGVPPDARFDGAATRETLTSAAEALGL
jgi:hypothetical protein